MGGGPLARGSEPRAAIQPLPRRGPAHPTHERNRSGCDGPAGRRDRSRSIAAGAASDESAPRGRPRPFARRSSRVGRRQGFRARGSVRRQTADRRQARRGSGAVASARPHRCRSNAGRSSGRSHDRIAACRRACAPRSARSPANAAGLLVAADGEHHSPPALPRLQQRVRKQWKSARRIRQIVENRLHQAGLKQQPRRCSRQLDNAPKISRAHRPDQHLVGDDGGREVGIRRDATVDVCSQREITSTGHIGSRHAAISASMKHRRSASSSHWVNSSSN